VQQKVLFVLEVFAAIMNEIVFLFVNPIGVISILSKLLKGVLLSMLKGILCNIIVYVTLYM
jgi:hypothetical protein